ncbi:MAG: ABC-type transport auxiliary lipoprotein family protein [Thermomonas sp.]|uniref:ABC-type transport auxiliary lipoprotein family protein n=1 Tax=Thermomonas sp. TaxID=1971895 RepID=UPI0039E3BA40
MTAMFRILIFVALHAALAGCNSLLGPKSSSTLYAPTPQLHADAAWPTVNWPLGMVRPAAPRILDSTRIAVRPVPGELQVYKDAMWASPPPDMLEDAVLRALEDSGRIPAVARQGSGIAAEYRLAMEIRHFEADYQGDATPSAIVEVNAKLLHARDQSVAGNRTFRHAQPAASTEVASVAGAFEQALGAMARDIAGWTLATGEAHRKQAHP